MLVGENIKILRKRMGKSQEDVASALGLNRSTYSGYENNIAMVPIAAVISLAIGGDLILAAGMSVGAITVGFGLSQTTPKPIG